MPSARSWHFGRLALAWLVAGILFLVVRGGLEAGVREVQMEGHRVMVVSGIWPATVASMVTIGFGLASVAAVAWLTYSWVTGSRERRRMATLVGKPHRRPLM